jgi:hypothetical protein
MPRPYDVAITLYFDQSLHPGLEFRFINAFFKARDALSEQADTHTGFIYIALSFTVLKVRAEFGNIIP